MSWIFFILLVGYGLARLILRVRGNLRYLRARRDEAPPRRASEVPDHLRGGLGELFAAGEAHGCALDERRRVIGMLLHVDPDASFGEIRDGRFRRNVLESMQFMDRWLAVHETLSESERVRAEDLGVAADDVTAVRERLRPIARRVARARALEPFAVADVRAVHDGLRQVVSTLDDVRDRLRDGAAHPYRGAEGAPVRSRRPDPAAPMAAITARARA